MQNSHSYLLQYHYLLLKITILNDWTFFDYKKVAFKQLQRKMWLFSQNKKLIYHLPEFISIQFFNNWIWIFLYLTNHFYFNKSFETPTFIVWNTEKNCEITEIFPDKNHPSENKGWNKNLPKKHKSILLSHVQQNVSNFQFSIFNFFLNIVVYIIRYKG